MAIAVVIRQVNGVAVLDLSGRLTVGEAIGLVRTTIQDLLASGQKKLVLNLADVTYMDSAGLGGLISVRGSVAEQAGHLVLLNLAKKIHELLKITHTDKIFEIHDDEATALASFSSK